MRPKALVNTPEEAALLPAKMSSAGNDKISRRFFMRASAVTTATIALNPLEVITALGNHVPTNIEMMLKNALLDTGIPAIEALLKAADNRASKFFQLNSESQIINNMQVYLPGTHYINELDVPSVYAVINATNPGGARFEERATKVMNFYDVSCYTISNRFDTEGLCPGLIEVLDHGRWGEMPVYSNPKSFPADGIILPFRSTDRNGIFRYTDPVSGETTDWFEWTPVAGEASWDILALAHTHNAVYGKNDVETRELRIAEEIAANLMLMQAENGGIRHSLPFEVVGANTPQPLIDYSLWNTISTENNISAYAAFRALYDITGKQEYIDAMKGIEDYLYSVAKYNPSTGECYFALGAHSIGNGEWVADDLFFATDCQTWSILCLGIDKVNEIFHEKYGITDASLYVWDTTVKRTGQETGSIRTGKELIGFSFYDKSAGVKQDAVMVEQAAGGMLTALTLYERYKQHRFLTNALSMRKFVETLRWDLAGGERGYPYANKRIYNNFNWWILPPNVLNTAATAWMRFADYGRNIFLLDAPTMPVAQVISYIATIVEDERRGFTTIIKSSSAGMSQPASPLVIPRREIISSIRSSA
ncbi:MAG: hypothetical protein ABH843_03705 [Candidatus Omnitrophota bacterium]